MEFTKLDATGNDFVALDWRNRDAALRPSATDVVGWCDRGHGIGADGVLLLFAGEEGLDFRLVFLNPDGSEAFCGNGARAAFDWWSGMDDNSPASARFAALDGVHEGRWMGGLPAVDLLLGADPVETPLGWFVHTGTEHLVVGMSEEEVDRKDLLNWAPPLRHHASFAPRGVNVNAVALAPDSAGHHAMRTYEKGVEAETLSCGSGTVAAAACLRDLHGGDAFAMRAPGGLLGVAFEGKDRAWLSGAVEMPFSGTILPS